MDYISAKEASRKWGVTVRWVQKCCKDGLIPGAARLGNAWGIPKEALRPSTETKENPAAFMPLMSSAFSPGECRHYVQNIPCEDERNLAMAEYYYFHGQPEQAVSHAEIYLNHKDTALRLSAGLICGYGNLSLGRIHAARLGFHYIRETLASQTWKQKDIQIQAICIFAYTMASVLLHLPVLNSPPLSRFTPHLPEGLRLYACYLTAHAVYLQGDYRKSLGIAETALCMQPTLYPIPAISIHLIAAMNLMSLKQASEAKQHFLAAWEIARPDDLIESFGEHHGLLQGLVETCIREAYPKHYERVIAITYRFSAGWRKIHNPDAGEEIADNLTTIEFTVAMLANRGWTNKEIAAHLKMSVHTVKHYISAVYQKLGISNRNQLHRYMLR